jgi:hypothetical protein
MASATRFHDSRACDGSGASYQLATFAAQMGETGHPLHGDTWMQAEATKVIDLFQHASIAGEAVVTHLDLTRTGKRSYDHAG